MVAFDPVVLVLAGVGHARVVRDRCTDRGDVIDLDATLGEKLFEVPMGQPDRRYQRTANMITSGGNRNPVNPERTSQEVSNGECASSSHPHRHPAMRQRTEPPEASSGSSTAERGALRGMALVVAHAPLLLRGRHHARERARQRVRDRRVNLVTPTTRGVEEFVAPEREPVRVARQHLCFADYAAVRSCRGPGRQRRSVSAKWYRRLLGSGIGVWSGREDLNLDSFPGREACCNYTTSAKSASDEADTFAV